MAGSGEKIIKLIPPAAGVGTVGYLMAEGNVGERVADGIQWHLHIGDVSQDQQGVNEAQQLVVTKPKTAEIGALIEDVGLLACAGLVAAFTAKAIVRAVKK